MWNSSYGDKNKNAKNSIIPFPLGGDTYTNFCERCMSVLILSVYSEQCGIFCFPVFNNA